MLFSTIQCTSIKDFDFLLKELYCVEGDQKLITPTNYFTGKMLIYGAMFLGLYYDSYNVIKFKIIFPANC